MGHKRRRNEVAKAQPFEWFPTLETAPTLKNAGGSFLHISENLCVFSDISNRISGNFDIPSVSSYGYIRFSLMEMK
ncbi:MAG: hypothetical protein K1X92_01800 [Bacteroidia bacterium]|nr:hypothetical protein [Bacteroidia bacterium]